MLFFEHECNKNGQGRAATLDHANFVMGFSKSRSLLQFVYYFYKTRRNERTSKNANPPHISRTRELDGSSRDVVTAKPSE